jgi:hypothetical protein
MVTGWGVSSVPVFLVCVLASMPPRQAFASAGDRAHLSNMNDASAMSSANTGLQAVEGFTRILAAPHQGNTFNYRHVSIRGYWEYVSRTEEFIEWESGRVPQHCRTGRVTFVWCGASDFSREPHRVYLDGKEIVQFRSRDRRECWWTKGDCELFFDLKETRSGIYHGVYYLTVPVARIRPGNRSRIRIDSVPGPAGSVTVHGFTDALEYERSGGTLKYAHVGSANDLGDPEKDGTPGRTLAAGSAGRIVFPDWVAGGIYVAAVVVFFSYGLLCLARERSRFVLVLVLTVGGSLVLSALLWPTFTQPTATDPEPIPSDQWLEFAIFNWMVLGAAWLMGRILGPLVVMVLARLFAVVVAIFCFPFSCVWTFVKLGLGLGPPVHRVHDPWYKVEMDDLRREMREEQERER